MVYRGEKTKIVDLRGKTMFPGFIDPHIHMFFTILNHWLDLGPFNNRTYEQIKKKIVDKVKEIQHKKSNGWVLGQLFDPSIMPGEFDVSREGLDKISETVPIFILEANGHVAHVNSAALRIANISKETPDPDHGRLMRNEEGELTG